MVDLNRLRGVSARSEPEGDISPSPKKAELKEKMEALSVSIRRKKERKEQPPPTNGEMPVAGKYNLTQDEATVETAYKNGKTKTTEDIKVSRVTDTVEENKTVVNTTVIAEKKELHRNGKTAAEHYSSSHVSEKYRDIGNNTRTETSRNETTEFDRRGRARKIEETQDTQTTSEADALDRTHGYDGSHSRGTSQTITVDLDKQGRERIWNTHNESFGLTSSLSDSHTETRRGYDINEISPETNKGIKETTQARGTADKRNRQTVSVDSYQYGTDGNLKKSWWGRLTDGIKETYGKTKVGKKTTQTEITIENGEITGQRTIIDKKDNIKRKKINKGMAKLRLAGIRRKINNRLKETGNVANMEEYADKIPAVDQTARAPLGLAFDTIPDREKYEENKREDQARNDQLSERADKITATDVINNLIREKYMKE